ncbi:efflux RND transporter periplasmic adaptor subunit [Lysobacter soli]|uniref:Efflux RND transporter periplasmic adaptor subunit n=1 Tax=Lysobacter soli TaxID=453783 RepID=A0A3D8V8E0_9GAMM|nr:efflux RND transporter periplasmic adaptor subunit [Lysobacter soli]RDY65672.1 efflux RND transporter periplasmic adaptor subunit [Lysobacter soli]
MRSPFLAAFRLSAWTLVAFSTFLLSACGRDGAVEEAPRPVLVTHPVAADHTASAFAGDVRAREESPLSFRVGGKLVQRNVDVGDHVRAGQVLATLDPGDLEAQARAAKAQLAAAEAELGRARADQARFAKLANEQLVSRSTLDAQNAAATAAQGQVNAARAEVEVASNQAAYSQLRATRDGVIAARQAEAGQVVAAGQLVFTLAADGVREIAFALPETMAGKVKAGQPVQVEAWSRPGQRWNGRIREISPAADPASRTFAARVTVDAPAGAIDLGQSARVYLPTDTRGGLSVPIAALQRENGKASVFVVDMKTSTVKLRPVQAGAFGEDRVPVQGELAANEWIVAAGGHLLRDGQKVQPVDRENRPIAASAR